jgi:serine/threonine-protein kinase
VVPDSSRDGPLEPGLRINGNYELVRQLGSGGMACVWLARHLRTGDRVAVKFPLPAADLGIDLETADARLKQEFELSRSFSHDHIVRVRELDRFRDRWCFHMEVVEGEPLSEWLPKRRDRRPSLEESARILVRVASALEYVHRKGIVHRDVSPANVLVSEDGRQVTLIDFGIAQGADITKTQQADFLPFLGKPRYAAPEQVYEFSIVGARADLYSLAAMACEMLTGARFDRHEAESRLAEAVLPKAIRVAVRRGLSEDPSERQLSVEAFIEPFAALLRRGHDTQHPGEQRGEERPKSVGRQPRSVLAGLIVLPLMGTALALVFAREPELESVASPALPSVREVIEPREAPLLEGTEAALLESTEASTDVAGGQAKAPAKLAAAEPDQVIERLSAGARQVRKPKPAPERRAPREKCELKIDGLAMKRVCTGVDDADEGEKHD